MLVVIPILLVQMLGISPEMFWTRFVEAKKDLLRIRRELKKDWRR